MNNTNLEIIDGVDFAMSYGLWSMVKSMMIQSMVKSKVKSNMNGFWKIHTSCILFFHIKLTCHGYSDISVSPPPTIFP